MRITTFVEHSDEGLNLILRKAQEFERESVLNGISSKKYTVYDIEQIIATVKEYHAKLTREANAIAHFAITFNQQFTTDNNKCFELAEIIFRKIRSSVSGTKKIYKKFCKTIRLKYHLENDNRKASVFSHSIIASGSFNKDIFGESSYPKVVNTLCNELESFFSDLEQIIHVCIYVINNEELIRKDPNTLSHLYESDYSKTKAVVINVIKQLKSLNSKLEIDPITKYKRSHSNDDFLVNGFHKYNKSELTDHVIYNEICKESKNELEDTESAIWANNTKMIPLIRIIIAHFDELDAKGNMDNKKGKHKLNSETLARFEKWCKVDIGNEKTFIEDYFNVLYKGEFLPIKSNTVNTAKKKWLKTDDTEYPSFERKINHLLTKYNANNQIAS